jgi:hypothetical protein
MKESEIGIGLVNPGRPDSAGPVMPATGNERMRQDRDTNIRLKVKIKESVFEMAGERIMSRLPPLL